MSPNNTEPPITNAPVSTGPVQPSIKPPRKKLTKKQLILISSIGGAVLLVGGILLLLWLNSPSNSGNRPYNQTVAEESKPAEDDMTEEEKEQAQKEAAARAVSETCLVPSDAHDFFGVANEYLPTDVTRYFYSETVYFNGNSAEYSNPEAAKPRYDKLAEFYKRYSKKLFIYYIQATTYEDNTSTEGAQIAQARANRAQKELFDRGVPQSFIVIEQPRTSTYNADGMRNTVITIRGSKNC